MELLAQFCQVLQQELNSQDQVRNDDGSAADVSIPMELLAQFYQVLQQGLNSQDQLRNDDGVTA